MKATNSATLAITSAWVIFAVLMLCLLTGGCATLKEAAGPEIVTELPAPPEPPYVALLATVNGSVVDVTAAPVLPETFTITECGARTMLVALRPTCSTRIRTFGFRALNRVTRVALYVEVF